MALSGYYLIMNTVHMEHEQSVPITLNVCLCGKLYYIIQCYISKTSKFNWSSCYKLRWTRFCHQ